MSLATIIYYGSPGLQAQTLAAYFSKLGYCVHSARTIPEIQSIVQVESRPLVVLDLDASPSTLIHLSREIAQDPSSAFPHIFILYDGKPFDTTLESVTLIAGRDKLRRLAHHIMAAA